MRWIGGSVQCLSLPLVSLTVPTVLAKFGPTSCLEMKSDEANIPFLGEVLGGKHSALCQYRRYTTWHMILNYDNDSDCFKGASRTSDKTTGEKQVSLWIMTTLQLCHQYRSRLNHCLKAPHKRWSPPSTVQASRFANVSQKCVEFCVEVKGFSDGLISWHHRLTRATLGGGKYYPTPVFSR